MQGEDTLKQKVKQQFGRNAEKYVTSESHAKGNDLSTLVEWIKPKPHWVVLDIATGGGHVAKTLSPYVAHVFAADLTRQMLANTARHLTDCCQNICYVVADAESLPFLDETFDVVTCRIAAHHFPHPERFVSEVARVLKPSGKFLFIDNIASTDRRFAEFSNTLEKMRDESHVRCLSISDWRGLFASSGLVEIDSLGRKKIYDFPVWVERTANSHAQIQQVKQYLLDVDEEIQGYFSVEIDQGEIKSLQVDEWMVLCEKTA